MVINAILSGTQHTFFFFREKVHNCISYILIETLKKMFKIYHASCLKILKTDKIIAFIFQGHNFSLPKQF